MVVVKLCGVFSLIVSIDGLPACSTTTFATETSCSDGQSYYVADAAATCVADPCVYDETAAGIADNDACCNVNAGQKCSEFVADGLCGAGQSTGFTSRGSSTNRCADAGSCDFDIAYDQKSCCKATTGEKCSAGVDGKDGWCSAGTTYDTAKKNNKCVDAACDTSVLDDQNACCSTTKGSETCKVGFAEDGKCSSEVPGLTYNKAKADKKCVALCDAEKLDDTNTCCMATTGLTCSKANIATGMCGAGLEYDESNKKNNKCVDKDACDFSVLDDVHACCSPLKGTAKCGTAKVGATAGGFCGAGMTYDANRATKSCSGASCSKANKDDIKTCCKPNDGEGVCKDMGETLCGAGKSLNPDLVDSLCVGKACSDKPDDVGTCCMDNAGASCSDDKNGATDPFFCGDGNTYKAGSTTKCKQAKCASGNVVDSMSCCMSNEGETCDKIEAVTKSSFCGTGKVIDTSKNAHKCASSKCSPASKEDVLVCCKTAPKTTVVTTKAPTKNVTTPGTTGSAHANLVGTVSLFFMGCLSQLM